MKAQFFIISAVIMMYVIVLTFQYLTGFSDIRLTKVEEQQELSYIQSIKDSLIKSLNASYYYGCDRLDADLNFTEKFLKEEMIKKGIKVEFFHNITQCPLTYFNYTFKTKEFFTKTEFSISPTCPNGVCEAGEYCPVDAGSCPDNACYEPTCTNGCGQVPAPYGQADEACNAGGCLSPPCRCDGSGNCVNIFELWFFSNQPYRRNITINNLANGNNLINYQVFVNVSYISDTNSHAQPDFDDLRFTYYNSTSQIDTEIDYWIEKYVASSYAEVWVEVPFIVANGYETVYMYYGNSSVSTTSNGTNTFISFDDMDSATTQGDKWLVSADGSTGGTPLTYHQGSYLNMYVNTESGITGGGRTGVLNTSAIRPGTGSIYLGGYPDIHYSASGYVSVGFDYYIQTLNVPARWWVVYAYVVFRYSDGTVKMVRLKDSYQAGHQWRTRDYANGPASGGGDVPSANTTVLTGDTTGTWYTKCIKSLDYYSSIVSDVYIGVGGGFDNSVGYGSIEVYYDNVRIRKYASPEPTYSMGLEES